MNPRRWLVVAIIVSLPAPALGQDKKPDAKPKEIDKATIAAWEKRGFKLWSPEHWPRWVRGKPTRYEQPDPCNADVRDLGAGDHRS